MIDWTVAVCIVLHSPSICLTMHEKYHVGEIENICQDSSLFPPIAKEETYVIEVELPRYWYIHFFDSTIC